MDGKTGAKKWDHLSIGAVDSVPAIGSSNLLYFGSYDNKIYALNRSNGLKKWEFSTGQVLYANPAIGADGNVYIGSLDHKIYGINGATGAKLWEFSTKGGGRPTYGSCAIGKDGTVLWDLLTPDLYLTAKAGL